MPDVIVDPSDALVDEPAHLQMIALDPHARVRVRLRAETLRAEAWSDFVADEKGIVDCSYTAPVKGDYEGRDAMALFWAARFDAGADLLTMLSALTSLLPLAYTLTSIPLDASR